MINKKQLKRYCCEDISKIENYDTAVNNPERWDCHHRFETFWWFRTSMNDLVESGLYWNRPASELILLPHSEHQRLHLCGWKQSDEVKQKMSIGLMGRPSTLKGKRLSEETRMKMSIGKMGNTACLGMFWWTNGSSCKIAKECPGDGWRRGRK